jgi:hypothetical protein
LALFLFLFSDPPTVDSVIIAGPMLPFLPLTRYKAPCGDREPMRDSDVRRAVKNWLGAEYAHDPDSYIVEEMGVWSGTVRIDIAVINGALSGYELKSDRDTLERLPHQRDIYGHVFDYLHLIVGKRHTQEAEKLLPTWWGIRIAVVEDNEIKLTPYREPSLNPLPNSYLIAELLSKDEAVRVLTSFGMDKGWRSKKIRLIHERLASELPLDVLKQQVRSILKLRPRSFTVSPSAPAQCVY